MHALSKVDSMSNANATPSATAVGISGLRKSFGSNEVLKGIDLNVQSGEVIAIIGKSGSGKSTLLGCCNRLNQPQNMALRLRVVTVFFSSATVA